MTQNIMIAIAISLALGYLLLKRLHTVVSSDAHRLVAEGARLVDVRTAQEFATGHIPGAVNIPVQELGRRMEELGAKERPIVVYCRSGNRSGSAARMLRSAGYSEVHDLGSMSRW